MGGLHKVNHILYTHFSWKMKIVKGVVLYADFSYIQINMAFVVCIMVVSTSYCIA